MHKRYQCSIYFILILLLVVIAACTPETEPIEPSASGESVRAMTTLTPELSTVAATDTLSANDNSPVTDTPTSRLDWPAYTLNTELPNSPVQMTLYTQTVPAGLPNDERLAELMTQLKITGEASTRKSEVGNTTLDITSDKGSVMLDSDDPLIMVLNNEPAATNSGTSTKLLSPTELFALYP